MDGRCRGGGLLEIWETTAADATVIVPTGSMTGSRPSAGNPFL